MKFKLACALWDLELLPASELPAAARAALAEGFQSSALLEVARTSSVLSMHESKELFRSALTEIGRASPPRAAAAVRCARRISQNVLDETADPIDGARRLWDVSLLVHDDEFHALDAFIYAASEYEEPPEDAAIFYRSHSIRGEAVVRNGGT